MRKVFVSGCFDVLHGGHLEFFRQAKALGGNSSAPPTTSGRDEGRDGNAFAVVFDGLLEEGEGIACLNAAGLGSG